MDGATGCLPASVVNQDLLCTHEQYINTSFYFQGRLAGFPICRSFFWVYSIPHVAGLSYQNDADFKDGHQFTGLNNSYYRTNPYISPIFKPIMV
jgi:hypothetical protein